MRLYTKTLVLHNPGWDDYTSVLAWLGFLANATLSLLQDHYGYGRHIWDMTGDSFTSMSEFIWAQQILYNPVIFVTKLSILLLYLRVFKPSRVTFTALHAVLWANLAFYIIATFIEIFQCKPMRKIYLPLLPGSCINQRNSQIASGAINVISDVAILILPIASVWKLRVYRKGKIGLFLIFGFGLFACVASTFRLALFIRFTNKSDGTWTMYPVNLWSAAELACGIVCGCIPALPAFIRHVSSWRVKVIVTRITRSGPSFASSGQRSTGTAARAMGGSIGSPKVEKARIREQWEELDDLGYHPGDERRQVENGEVRPVWPQSKVATMETGKAKKEGYRSVDSYQL